MDELSMHLKGIQRVTFISLVVCFIGWLILPSIREVLLGFMLGTFGGLLNVYFLIGRVRRITKNVAEGSAKRINLGFLTRVCVAILTVVIALELQEHMHIIATISGFLYTKFIILFVGIAQTLKKQ